MVSLSKPMAKKKHGFTLVELMIVVVLLAALTVLAGPSFQSFIFEQRARATLVDLRLALMMARSEALKRNRNIFVTPAAGGWSQGWRIANPDAALPDLLGHTQSGQSDVSITLTGATVGFSPAGRAAEPVVFTVVVGSGASSTTRCLKLDASGYVDSDCA